MNCGREQILSDYGYRIDKVKYNLLIDVDDPSIDWGIYNFEKNEKKKRMRRK